MLASPVFCKTSPPLCKYDTNPMPHKERITLLILTPLALPSLALLHSLTASQRWLEVLASLKGAYVAEATGLPSSAFVSELTIILILIAGYLACCWLALARFSAHTSMRILRSAMILAGSVALGYATLRASLTYTLLGDYLLASILPPNSFVLIIGLHILLAVAGVILVLRHPGETKGKALA